MNRIVRSTGLLLALLVAGTGAQASLTTFPGVRNSGSPGAPSGAPLTARTDFLAMLSPAGVGVENFSSFDVGSGTPLSVNFSGSSNTGTITGASGENFVNNNADETTPLANRNANNGRYDTTGLGDRFLDAGVFTLEFTNLVNAFGFYATDVGDFGDVATQFSVVLIDKDGFESSFVVDSGARGNASLLFWGFVDTDKSYKAIRFNPASTDYFGIDDMTVGNLPDTQPPAVPEPMSALLALAALAAAGAARRARR